MPLLLQQNKTAKTIAFGPIATQLLECVQAIQERKHVVVDVKPDNFMLSYGAGKGSSASQKLASRIRILDLALVQPWASIGSHRSNDGTKGLAGTPLYASLNVHRGETPSRRDDLEALGYVFAELLIRLASGDNSKQLPWSNGKSDDEIGELKKRYVEDPKSDFYNQLGGPLVKAAFVAYMDEVRSYSFKKKPEYETLSEILRGITVPVSTKKKQATAPAAKKRATKRKTPAASGTKRTTRSQRVATSSGESPQKVQRDASFMEVESISDESSVEEAQFHDAFLREQEEDDYSFVTANPEPMDWEVIPDENDEPIVNSKPKPLVGVTVVIESGPHKGQAFNLVKDASQSFILGRNPTTKEGEKAFALHDDEDVDDSHIRLKLNVSKKLIGVIVTDLKSSGGSFVGREKIRKGKDYQIFRGGSVRIGETILTVKKLDPSTVVTTTRESKSSKRVRSSKKPKAQLSSGNEESEETFKVKTSLLQRRGVRLEVTEGPHTGESFELESGGTETFIVGSKPSSRSGEPLRLSKDTSLKATHLRLDLVVSKKLTTVAVTDKSKGATVVNRDTVNKGRAFINDTIKIGNSALMIKPI